MQRASGTEFAPLDLDHPLGPMLATTKSKLAYQVHFDLSDHFEGTVVARSAGGAVIAVDAPLAGGRLVLLPPPARALESQSRYQVSEALQEAIRRTLRLPSGSGVPAWLDAYDLPGLVERRQGLSDARQRLSDAATAVDTAADELESIGLYQRLLWEEGRFALSEAVHAALTLVGFRVRTNGPGAPATVELASNAGASRTALLEIAASEDAAGMDAHYAMRRRIEDAVASGRPANSQLRGLLVVNGYRRRDPSERPPQYTPELANAAAQLRYALTTTEQLFHAIRAALSGDDTTVERFRERLLTTDGVLSDD
jgi:hypothetical protein